MTSGLVIHEARQGNRQALTEVYREHFATIWRFVAAHLTPNRQAIEDVVSETWLAAVRDFAKFDPARKNVVAWLLGIARHKVYDWGRKYITVPPALSREEPVDPRPGPDDELFTGETGKRVLAILKDLPERLRLALVWRHFDGVPVREIAARLEMKTEKAAEGLLAKARFIFGALWGTEN